MKPRSYTSTGIILSKRNYGEADKIITIYSRDLGKISFMAHGVRRPKSRKRGHLEIFNLINFQGVRGNGLDALIEAEVIEDFKGLRKSLKKISLAYYLCEVVNKITNEREMNLSIFDLLLRNINYLIEGIKLREIRLNFIHELLTITGYHPKGEALVNHDLVLQEVIERKVNSQRVGIRMLQ